MAPAAGIGAKKATRRDWAEARAKVEAEHDRCRVCGASGAQAAHIIARSQGGGQSADSIVPLCAVHHALYDAFDLDLLPYLTTAEQVEAVRVAGLYRAYRRITGEGRGPSPLEAARLGEAAA
jgi:hypothetical protein